MIITSITAIFILPFMAEWFAAEMPAATSGEIKRSPAFYMLVPLMGALVFTGFAALTARPYMALAASVLFFGGLTAVSNKKYEILRDPFNAHDFDNLRNLYIYPEFYISYVGWPVMFAILGIFSIGVGLSLYSEPPFAFYDHFPPYTGWAIVFAGWLFFTYALQYIVSIFFNEETATKYGVTLELQKDVARFGLFPTVLLYRVLLKANIDKKALRERPLSTTTRRKNLSDIIAIQGESYFDIERLFEKLPAPNRVNWSPLRNLENEGVKTGQVTVPSWGAYTMQTEFSFLSTLGNDSLGIDRINPYMRFAQQPVSTIATALRAAGYRTICIHPSKKEFFRRSDVIGNLGFDEFIGLEAFKKASIYGRYISDSALSHEIDQIIANHHEASEAPLFIFAITIESHGPWAPGRLARHLDEKMLIKSNAFGDHEFSLFQKHMENLLKLFKRLSIDSKSNRPRTVAMYGDHMPALGRLFTEHGFDDDRVDYLIWNSGKKVPAQPASMQIEEFGKYILKEAGLTLKG